MKAVQAKKEKARGKKTESGIDFYDWFDSLEFKLRPKDEKSLPNGGGK
jgi:hypothetical protein